MTSSWDVALEPLRSALLSAAQSDAVQLRASAEADGQQVLAAAQAQADAMLAEARAEGAADGEALREAQRAVARRAARTVVLKAERDVFDQLREQARVAVSARLADPVRRAALGAAMRIQLHDHALVRSTLDGGLVAEASNGRRVDASVRALVDAALADLDLEELWAP
jgi:hypothetical protein